MNVQEKEVAVAELTERFANSNAVFLVDYQGCTCEQLTGLRKQLRPGGADLAIIKNTLAKRAAQGSEAVGLEAFFQGPTAVIWAKDDAVGPAKVIAKFAKDQEKFKVKAGLVDGQVVDPSGVESLASLPSRDELFGQLLALINAPATRLLQTINEPATQLARLVEAWRVELEKRQG